MPQPYRCSRPGGIELWATWSSGRRPCPRLGGWTRWSLKVPSNPNHSMTVCLKKSSRRWGGRTYLVRSLPAVRNWTLHKFWQNSGLCFKILHWNISPTVTQNANMAEAIVGTISAELSAKLGESGVQDGGKFSVTAILSSGCSIPLFWKPSVSQR